MKKNILTSTVWCLLSLLLFMQLSCVKDTCSRSYTYTYYEPVYKTTEEVIANIKSNPAKEIINPGKIYIKDNYIYLNEVNKGIHIIDNSDPANPKNKAFIDLPGNVDIAIKNNTLYADFYSDLVTINITNPLRISNVKILPNIFQSRYYCGFAAESGKIICDWIEKTTTVPVECNGNTTIDYGDSSVLYTTFNSSDVGLTSSTKASPVGISGSLARFTLINNYLYTVSNSSLKVINVTNNNNPVLANDINVGWGIETIFPFKDKLFIGSTSGMFIYSVENPDAPVQLSSFAHVNSCDPVIADDDFAYVTLHSGTPCSGYTNQLDVLNISNLQSPTLLRSYPLTSPRGLSKDGDLLFICDGNDGVKVFNAANPSALVLLKKLSMPEANDVITFNKIALVIGKGGLYQYDYSRITNIKLLSKIPVKI